MVLLKYKTANMKDLKKILGFDRLVMGRKRFLVNLILAFVIGAMFDIFSWREHGYYLVVQLVILILAGYIYIPSLIRRSKDAGWNKYWWFGLVPLLNFLYVIVLLLIPPVSDSNANTSKSVELPHEIITPKNKPFINSNIKPWYVSLPLGLFCYVIYFSFDSSPLFAGFLDLFANIAGIAGFFLVIIGAFGLFKSCLPHLKKLLQQA